MYLVEALFCGLVTSLNSVFFFSPNGRRDVNCYVVMIKRIEKAKLLMHYIIILLFQSHFQFCHTCYVMLKAFRMIYRLQI